MSVVYNGIDCERFPSIAEALEDALPDRSVLNVGNYVANKGAEMFAPMPRIVRPPITPTFDW